MNLWYRTTWTSILGQIPSLENWSNWPLCGRRIQLRWWPLYKLSTGLHRKTSRPTKTCEPSAPLQFILPPYREFVALLHLLLPRQQSKLKLGISFAAGMHTACKTEVWHPKSIRIPMPYSKVYIYHHPFESPPCMFTSQSTNCLSNKKKRILVGRRSTQVIIRNHNIMYHIVS
jgi:hypothetical protein